MCCAEAGLHDAPGHAYLIKQRCRESFQSRLKDSCRLLFLQLLSFLNLQTAHGHQMYTNRSKYGDLTSVSRL